jgi:hypothetical protein
MVLKLYFEKRIFFGASNNLKVSFWTFFFLHGMQKTIFKLRL